MGAFVEGAAGPGAEEALQGELGDAGDIADGRGSKAPMRAGHSPAARTASALQPVLDTAEQAGIQWFLSAA
ncbi:hypothetical protein [Streptomyces sp. NPDC048508]|uniref:hypothetical protein n=1 Tax=Streptomyces sp. NPDC048508 TaxID=3365561 RepID=UPI00371A3A9B